MKRTIPPGFDLPELAGITTRKSKMRFSLVIAVDVKLHAGAQKHGAEGIGAVCTGLDLPILSGEVTLARHLDMPVFGAAAVVDDVEGVAREGVAQPVPSFVVEPGRNNGLDSNFNRHCRA